MLLTLMVHEQSCTTHCAPVVQPSPRMPGRSDYGRGRGRIRPAGGRYMAQRTAADYIDSQPAYYNDTPYNYAVDTYAPPQAYASNGQYEHGVTAQHLGVQHQPQSFGMTVGHGFGHGANSVGLGHVGDSRSLSGSFQQVRSLQCLTSLLCLYRSLRNSCMSVSSVTEFRIVRCVSNRSPCNLVKLILLVM